MIKAITTEQGVVVVERRVPKDGEKVLVFGRVLTQSGNPKETTEDVIIASSFNLPNVAGVVIEDELTDNVIVMAQQYALSKCTDNMSAITKVKLAVEYGYTQAKANTFSEEDMRKAIRQSYSKGISRNPSYCEKEYEDNLIQSLTTKSYEVIMDGDKPKITNGAYHVKLKK